MEALQVQSIFVNHAVGAHLAGSSILQVCPRIVQRTHNSLQYLVFLAVFPCAIVAPIGQLGKCAQKGKIQTSHPVWVSGLNCSSSTVQLALPLV